LKKPTGSVRFRFFKPGTGKTKPNRTEKTGKKPSQTEKTEPKPSQTEKTKSNRKKPSQTEPKPSQTEKTEPNRFEPVFSLKKPNRTKPKLVGLNRFRFFFFLKKFQFGYFF